MYLNSQRNRQRGRREGMKYRVGEKITLKDYSRYGDWASHKGQTATIIEVTGFDYRVQWDDGSTSGSIKEADALAPAKIKTAHIMQTLVLPPEYTKLILATVEASKEENIQKIFVEWGFEETIEKGKGSIILLFGPPGTGKTMCAEGIAELLGRNFLMLGSGDFQSSIPGRCEDNMKEAFKRATNEKLVVILDECDSVVHSRKGVGAILGAEINCLLMEIERFEGVCVLTTNRAVVLDEALERRVALKLEFKNPEENVRAEIWRKLVPAKAPLGENVNFPELTVFNITGGQIKNAILTAARIAVNEKSSCIRREHLLEGVKRELLGSKMWDNAKDNIPLLEEMSLKQETSITTDKVSPVMLKKEKAHVRKSFFQTFKERWVR
jgi:SpoVK/Ycf46/Vps4 family AAA+-type ATPase